MRRACGWATARSSNRGGAGGRGNWRWSAREDKGLRAGELLARGGGLAQRVVALLLQAFGEGWELLDPVLELAHAREA